MAPRITHENIQAAEFLKCLSDQLLAKCLVAQVTGTVRWRESVAFMAGAGVNLFLELGSGKVLTGLLKRIAQGASGMAIGTPADIAAYTARAA